jgi:hypothetical protein
LNAAQALRAVQALRANDKKKGGPKAKRAALLGLGLDGGDSEETRITRGKNFLLYGGSPETHSEMQETAIKVNERLDRDGKRLDDIPPSELRDMIQEIRDK